MRVCLLALSVCVLFARMFDWLFVCVCVRVVVWLRNWLVVGLLANGWLYVCACVCACVSAWVYVCSCAWVIH